MKSRRRSAFGNGFPLCNYNLYVQDISALIIRIRDKKILYIHLWLRLKDLDSIIGNIPLRWRHSVVLAPHSSITHVCEILPARTRNEGDLPLEEDGFGNEEFNSRHKDWDGYDFAYKIISVYELRDPISLSEMRAKYDFKSALRGLVYLPKALNQQVR
ncbi:uncharacterized protein DFL_008631 [Arthrobotrys flagrans]|uniref:Uncharacterized protein n=1 Tax=Arthrobotrys flagrans TaxID=97331 RepID=A0A436ZPB0_ARTFL|nr:hypothetical protein DFL_008631 [Arthrobotrys flagrans]